MGELRSMPTTVPRFDLATAIDVVEHVTDPAALLEDIQVRLAKGGGLYIQVPNVRSLVYRLGMILSRSPIGLRPRSALERLFPPQHLQYFTERGLTCMAARLGFSIEYMRCRPLEKGELAVSPLLQALLLVWQYLDRVLGRGIVINAVLRVREDKS
jgi:hypothetical protein